MHALLDLDILCYEMGSARDPDTKHPLSWPLVRARLEDRITSILEATDAESWQGYLTGKENFRERVATIVPYKGHRNRGERPFWYYAIFAYLRDVRRAIVVDGMEADDAISIAACSDWMGSIICSRDKDLRMVPGWHYQWPSWKQEEQHVFNVGPIDGLRFFYEQLLTGDRADNIPGLYRVGPKSVPVQTVREATTEQQMFRVVQKEYELRFGSYWDMFMCENGRLLWMLRSEGDDWYHRQKNLTETLREQMQA